jgi:hypothetical protein
MNEWNALIKKCIDSIAKIKKKDYLILSLSYLKKKQIKIKCKHIFILSEIYIIFIFFLGGGLFLSYLSGSKTGAILSDNEKTKDTLHW